MLVANGFLLAVLAYVSLGLQRPWAWCQGFVSPGSSSCIVEFKGLLGVVCFRVAWQEPGFGCSRLRLHLVLEGRGLSLGLGSMSGLPGGHLPRIYFYLFLMLVDRAKGMLSPTI